MLIKKTVHVIVFSLLTLLLILPEKQVTATENTFTLPTLEVVRLSAEETILIDGHLDEAGWQHASAAELRLVGTPWDNPSQLTEARLLTDGQWLFVGFNVTDRTPLSPEAAKLGGSGLTSRDCVEFYLDPGTGSREIYRFASDRLGNHLMDSFLVNPDNKQEKLEFVAHWRVAAALTDSGWSAEMAIPLFYFIEKYGSSEPWRVNFCRLDTQPREISSWAPVDFKFAEAARFGTLQGLDTQTTVAPFTPRLTHIMAGPTTDQTGEYVSLVQVGIVNDSSATAGTVYLKMLDESVPGKPVEFTTNVTLSLDAPQNIFALPLSRPLEFIPAPSVTLELEDNLGPWQQTMRHGEGRVEEALSVWLDRSYYTTESQAFLYLEDLQQKFQIDTVAVILKTDKACEIWSGVADLQAPGVWRSTIPIADLTSGSYHIETTLETLDKINPSSTQPIVLHKLLPPKSGNEIKIDHYHQCVLLNGEPFFPIGTCWRVARSADEDLEHLARLGFNHVIRWNAYIGKTDAGQNFSSLIKNDPLLDAAAKHNIFITDSPVNSRDRDAQNQRVWRWKYPLFVDNYYDWKANDLPVILTETRPHSSTLAYLSMDEPSDVTLQPGNVPLARILNDMMAAMKTQVPYHLVFLNFGGMLPDRLEWLDQQSIFSTFNYWRVQPDTIDTAQLLASTLKHNAAVADKHHKPLWLMPTIELNWSAQAVPMTALENRAQLYLLLVHGAKGINYFVWPWNHIATDVALVELIQEMKTLAPSLLQRRPKQQTLYTTPKAEDSCVFAALLAESESQTPILLLFNSASETIHLQCQLPWLPGNYTLSSLFTDESLEFHEGSFEVELGPLATRAYRLNQAVIKNIWQNHKLLLTVKRQAQVFECNEANLLPDPLFLNKSAWMIRERDEDRLDFIPKTVIEKDEIQLLDSDVNQWKTSSLFPRETEGQMLQIKGTDGGGMYVRSQPVRLQPYHRYRLTAVLRYQNASKGPTAGMTLRDADQNGTPDLFGGLIGGNPSNSDWQITERTFDIRSDHPQNLRLVIYWNAPPAGELTIRNLLLKDLGPTTKRANLKNRIPNSSFEEARLPGWPDYWEPYRMPEAIALMAENRLGTQGAPWGMDTNQPFHGKASLRIEPGIMQTQTSPYRRAHFGVPVEEGKTWTFSAWLRAAEPDTSVNIRLRGIGGKTFYIGTEWERVTLTGVKTNELAAVYQNFTAVMFRPRGTVWIDAVQLEEGEEATEYEE